MLGGVTIMAETLSNKNFHVMKSGSIIERYFYPQNKVVFIRELNEHFTANKHGDETGVAGELIRFADSCIRSDNSSLDEVLSAWTKGGENACTRLMLQFFNCKSQDRGHRARYSDYKYNPWL
jgi:hypothetical protein